MPFVIEYIKLHNIYVSTVLPVDLRDSFHGISDIISVLGHNFL